MRKRGVDLPMASGGRSPTPPRRQLNMPDATPANVFSFTWVLCGFALICIGYGHCSRHSEQSRLYCAEDVCRFSRDSMENRSRKEFQFLRESLVKAEVAHLDKNGELVRGKRASRRQKRGMAQTYTVTWKDAETQDETTLPIASYGLGRKVPRAKVARIMQYVQRQIDDLDVKEGRWFTGIGIVCFVFGGVLILLRVVVGSIFPQPPSRRDLSRRQLFK
ncbi:unnamed protein product [Ectocarpus sp. CCAP 1310/34]|nr:unnamed protein product [Ectocarpus sp. CCAP 1310/34]